MRSTKKSKWGRERHRRAILGGLVAAMLLLGGCDWTQFRFDAGRSGFSPGERIVGTENVADLSLRWRTGSVGPYSSPVVAGGLVFVGASDGYLRAFDEAGVARCSGQPNWCTPVWWAPVGDANLSSATVVNGVLYLGTADHRLYAFDAAGRIGCAGPVIRSCAPLWTATTGGVINSSPVVVNGVVYIGSWDAKLYAFDAAGTRNCGGNPVTCDPLWTATTGGMVTTSPAFADGVVYVGANDAKLYAFDAKGTVNCNGSARTCVPLWTAQLGGIGLASSPSVVGGVVYQGAFDGKLYAFDATGNAHCSGAPKSCTPLWTAATGGRIYGSPAVAGGKVYIGSANFGFYAFDATGVSNCSGTPRTCAPLWRAMTGGAVESSPAVANGVVYVGSDDKNLYAFDAAGELGCAGGTTKSCTPLWRAYTGYPVIASPAVANGSVYSTGESGALLAFGLPAA